jgi:hypothetical protein
MRGAVAALVLILAASPAAADGWGRHQRMELPPPSPAFADSDGSRFNHQAGDGRSFAGKTDLQRFAEHIGAGRNGRNTDFFRYSLNRDEVGGPVSGTSIAGGVSNGATEIQLRWNN